MKKRKKLILMMGLMLLMMAFMLPQKAMAASSSIRLSAKKATVSELGKKTLKATVTGKSKKVTWKSNQPKIATVNASGQIVGKKSGTAVITASANGKTASCTVKVVGCKSLYKKKLQRDSYASWYYILDINQDGIVELVTGITGPGGGGRTSYSIYTISNGKLKDIGMVTTRGMQPPAIYYVSKYKSIRTDAFINNGTAVSRLMTISGGKLKEKHSIKATGNIPIQYYVKEKKVSKATYDKTWKNMYGTYKKYNMKKNTATNRNNSFK